MNNNLVSIRLLGDLGKNVGEKWNFNVESVQEAIHAINTMTGNKFTDYFVKNNKLSAKYRVLINGRDFQSPESEINEKNWEIIHKSELVMKKKNLKTIDIVPILESAGGSGGIFAVILGVVLIIVGAILLPLGIGAFLIVAGLGILAAGVAFMLAKPPSFGKFRDPDRAGGQSYLFGGPVNTIGEGGPVPVGYGRLIVGSQVISSSYKIVDYQVPWKVAA